MQNDQFEALRQERELERFRSLVSPEYWPLIDAMLVRVREEIRKYERDDSVPTKAA